MPVHLNPEYATVATLAVAIDVVALAMRLMIGEDLDDLRTHETGDGDVIRGELFDERVAASVMSKINNKVSGAQ